MRLRGRVTQQGVTYCSGPHLSYVLGNTATRGEPSSLFNLKDDPSESKNLAAQEPERVRELRARLENYARQAVPPKATPKGPDFKSPKVWGETD